MSLPNYGKLTNSEKLKIIHCLIRGEGSPKIPQNPLPNLWIAPYVSEI